MPGATSVSLGCWATIGGRDEPATVEGASHFLEHLLFKGTESRSARDIAESIEAVGGEMNAFTAKEHTAYYCRLPASAADLGLDLLCDVVSLPAFRSEEVEAERQVILEEISLCEDEAEERVHSLAHEARFPGHPLGREVLGTTDSVTAMTRDDIAGFFGEHYHSANLVLVAAGAVEHDAVVAAAEAHLPRRPAAERPKRIGPIDAAVPVTVVRRSTEQAHLAIAWPAFDLHDPDRHALAVLNQILGGGLSSRLFQEIRERRGLAYSVYSYTSQYHDAGLLAAYAGSGPGRIAEVRRLILAEADAIVADGVTEHELEVAVGYLEGSLLLGLEDSSGRMARLGSHVVSRGTVTPVDEQIAQLRAVTREDVARVATRVLAQPPSVCAVGPVSEADVLA